MVVKLGAIGDVVNSLPLLCRLRAGLSKTRITWLIAPLAHALVEGHEAVVEFLVFDIKQRRSWPALWRQLRDGRFDTVLDLQRILKSAALSRASGAPRRIGFDRARSKEGSWLFSTESIAPNAAPGVTVAQYLEFADHLGLAPAPPEWRLPQKPWQQTPPRVALGLGATKPANLWPSAAWTELATRLADKHGAERIALVGGPSDRATAEAVCARGPRGLCNTVGQLSLQETAGLLAVSDLFVACDTGPLHMAVAVGTPVLALFGAADPCRTGPFGQAQAVLSHPVPCAPCRQRHCTVAGHPCMNELTVEGVWQGLNARLSDL